MRRPETNLGSWSSANSEIFKELLREQMFKQDLQLIIDYIDLGKLEMILRLLYTGEIEI